MQRILIACVVVFLAGSAASRGGDDVEIGDLVNQLGADQFKVRENATRLLTGKGVAAIAPLLAASQSDDPEVRWRSMKIISDFLKVPDVDANAACESALKRISETAEGKVGKQAAKLLEGITDASLQQLQAGGASFASDRKSVVIGSRWKGTDQHLAYLRRFPDLETVTFRKAKVGDDALAGLVHLPKLTKLELNEVEIGDAGVLQHLVNLATLRDLRLRKTKVTNDGLACVAGMKELETISIEYTKVDDDGLKQLSGLPKLNKIYAGASQVKGPGLKHLAACEKLNYISFQYLDLKDDAVPAILHLKHLETLGLDDTKVTDECIPHLAGLKNLKVLWLSNTEISDKSLDGLKALGHLRTLHINNVKISAEGAAELKEALSGVAVHHSVITAKE